MIGPSGTARCWSLMGGSTNRTKQVVEGLIRNPPETSERIKALIRLLDNHGRTASCGMKLGIAQAARFLYGLVKGW